MTLHKDLQQWVAMNLHNTTNEEDRTILLARKNPLDDLLDIITRLDNLIEEWKGASGCDDPSDLAAKLAEMEDPL